MTKARVRKLNPGQRTRRRLKTALPRAGDVEGVRLVLGHLVDEEADELWVEYPGCPAGRSRAQSTVPLTPTQREQLRSSGRQAVLLVDRDHARPPVLIGFLQTDAPPLVDARLDGRRVELEASQEIVLRCGEASLVLRRDGRVMIRGAYVETRAKGLNRIKGGSVAIN